MADALKLAKQLEFLFENELPMNFSSLDPNTFPLFKQTIISTPPKQSSSLEMLNEIGLTLTGRGSNGLSQKKLKFFSGREYCGLNPNPIGFRTKQTKTDYKSNYKFKSKILK